MDHERPPDTLQALQTLLQAGFRPPATAGLDATLRLCVGTDALLLRVRDGALEFRADTEPADVTFLFEDLDTAWALLTGRLNPFDAFMDGRFRSDGYLLWTFAVVTMFRIPTAPGDTA